MDPKILNFLSRHRIAALSVQMADGSIHAATCHFAHSDNPLQIIMLTGDKTRKASNLLDGKSASAAVTIGFSEEEWIEWQASGEIKLLRQDQYGDVKKAYEAKFKKTLELDSEDVFLVFTPKRWRYTEFKSEPKVMIESK